MEADRQRRAAHRRAPPSATAARAFGIDVRLPGMVYAAIRALPDARRQRRARSTSTRRWRCPASSGSCGSAPYAGSTAALAVVGTHQLACAAAAPRRCDVEWRAPPARRPRQRTRSTPALERAAREAAARDGGFAFHTRGDVPAALAPAPRTHRGGLPRAVPGARGDGADELHRAGRRRQGRGLGADAGAGPGARDGRAGGRRAAGRGDACTSPISAAASGAGSRSTSSARRCASPSRCGGRPVQLVWSREEDLDARLLPAGRRGACCAPRFDDDGRPLVAGDHQRRRRDHAALDRARRCRALAGPVDTPDKTTSEGLFDLPYDDCRTSASRTWRRGAACRSATGARSATRTTRSSASRSSTSWRSRRGRIR